MPEPGHMIGQRGSVLAGVLVLSLVMTLAAGGLLLTTAGTNSVQDAGFASRRLLAAGESAMQLAMRHMRARTPAQHAAIPNGSGLVPITPGYPGFFPLEGTRLRAAYEKVGGFTTVYAWATFGGTSDTVKIAWTIRSVDGTTPEPLTNFTLENWASTFLPYRP